MKDLPNNPVSRPRHIRVVRQRILRGDIVLGQVISRRKLAAELSMSFLPVSEALLRLEIEGLLESRPRAGTRVASVSRRRAGTLRRPRSTRSAGGDALRESRDARRAHRS